MNTAYRVWDGKRMYYSDDDELTMIIEPSGAWEVKQYGIRGETIAHSHDGKSVLMWGTGFKVKNGRQIYDRDMLIGRGMTHPLLVEWSDYYGAFRVDEDTKYLFHMLINYGLARYELEVIGDVYQNPELLEGAE
ncbi:YopX family protein [Bacillus atrophaeus]|uniref:YopX family protein n=1 Tax=Bacillus atrophaeus TaxID=1452 RepID=UPI003D23F9BC